VPGHCRVQVNKRFDSKAKQSIKEGKDSQLLLPVADLKTQWAKKGKEELQFLSKHQTGERREMLQKVLEEWLGSVVPLFQNEPPCLRANKPHENRPHQS
jgi:hypothetical protein